MNKTFLAILIALIVAVSGCAATSTSEVDNLNMSQITDVTMPNAFSYNGGDENSYFYLPCVPKFDSVLDLVCDLAGSDEAVQQWIDEMNANETPCDLEEYINLYSFMVYFDISGNDICNVLEEFNSILELRAQETGSSVNPTVYFTDDELAAIRSEDKQAIMAQFASEASIVIDDKIYCPNWIYYHTETDYAVCGITGEMIENKLDQYRQIRLSSEAVDALGSKLSNYIGADIDISYVLPCDDAISVEQ